MRVCFFFVCLFVFFLCVFFFFFFFCLFCFFVVFFSCLSNISSYFFHFVNLVIFFHQNAIILYRLWVLCEINSFLTFAQIILKHCSCFLHG